MMLAAVYSGAFCRSRRGVAGVAAGLLPAGLRVSYIWWIRYSCSIRPAQLIATRAENVPARRRATSGDKDGATDLNALRPAASRLVSGAAKKRTCTRCGHRGYPAASFPEGRLCWRCLTTALAFTGTCPGCGTDGRVLPSLRDGIRICRDCTDITREFCCLRWLDQPHIRDRKHLRLGMAVVYGLWAIQSISAGQRVAQSGGSVSM
jgi:hypothetical protein